MKIVYLLDDTLDKSDGVQQTVVTIGEYMRGLGHDVHYLVAESRRTDITNVHSIAKFVSLKFNGNSVRTPLPASKSAIREELAEIKPDVVHVQMPFSPFFAGRVIDALDKGARIVGTWHTFPTGGLQQLAHKPLHWMIKRALARVIVTIGVSKPTADFADSVYKTNSIIVPNAVDITRFAIRRKTSGERLGKHIVFLGRFDERKGPCYLIEALGHLKQTGNLPSDLVVTMGGKGPDLEKCKDLAHSFGLQGLINFPGFIDEADKPSLLASADISVFPSTGGEAFGISVVEAMAGGQSIVLGGDNPGYRSILGEKPELLFDPKDISNFAAKILHYLKLPENEVDVKKRWLKESAQQYGVKTVCEQLLEVYKKP